MKPIPVRSLDQVSLDYLAVVDRASGASANGVFIRCPGRRTSPRLWQVVGLCLGLAVVAVALIAVGILDFEQLDPSVAGQLQTVLLALGLWLAAGMLLALRRPVFRSPVGHFLWADTQHLWQVTPDCVTVYSLLGLRGATTTHFVNNSAYSHSEVFLRLRSGSESLILHSRAEADRLVQFLTANCLLPDDNAQPDPSLPGPKEVTPGEEVGQPGVVGRMLPRSLAVVAAVLGFMMLPRLNDSIREERLYAATTDAALGEELPFQRYLHVFPSGRRAEEVRMAFEDNLARHAADSPPGQPGRYENYVKLFPQGLKRDQVMAGYEDHLYRSTKAAAAGAEEAFQRYLAVFPAGRHGAEVRVNYDDNLYKATQGVIPGEEKPFQRYLAVCPQGRHVEEVQAAFEDNLARHAAASTPGNEERYKQYLGLFPKGRSVAGVWAGYEDNLHKSARDAPPGNVSACARYLEVFPKGRFVAEVKQLRDDHRFTLASTNPRTQESPALLRGYLSDPENVRHRPEAQRRIDALYDRVIGEVKKRTADVRNREDRELSEVVCGLLQGLKRTDSAVVSVGFRSRHTDEPDDAITKLAEKVAYKANLERYPRLKDLEQETGSAILSRGRLFDPAYTAKRETILLEQMRSQFSKAISTELLSLKAAARDATPDLEIGYHVTPSGTLLQHTQTLVHQGDGGPPEEAIRVQGLLRCYEIQWHLKVRPPGSNKPIEHRLTSKGADSIQWRSDSGDPNWVPYAIQLHMTYRDLNTRLIRCLGGQPAPVPDVLSFRETGGW